MGDRHLIHRKSLINTDILFAPGVWLKVIVVNLSNSGLFVDGLPPSWRASSGAVAGEPAPESQTDPRRVFKPGPIGLRSCFLERVAYCSRQFIVRGELQRLFQLL